MTNFQTNNSRSELINILESLEKRAGKDYIDWVKDYWTSRGQLLDFKQHQYLNQIYQDQLGKGNGEIVYQKSSQIGLTERLITESLWLPDQEHYNSIYFFPTSSTVVDLVQERVDDPINNSRYLSAVSGRAEKLLGKQADKIGLKRMSKGFIYFRGSNALPAITSVSADAIFVDELDRMEPQNVPYFEKRLEHSELRWKRWASTPTIHGFGINAKFLESDQTIYQVKCNHCNEWQDLDFWQNVDTNRECIICRKCKNKIKPFKLEGEWVSKYPDKSVKGYHINQLYSPRLNLKELIKASQKFSEFEVQQFYNQNLGLPYESKGAKLSEQDIYDCIKDYAIPCQTDKDKFMGVDVGKTLHYIIRTENRIIDIGNVSNFFGSHSLEEKMKELEIHGVVIDALPETRQVQEFIQRFSGKVKMCYYSGLVEMREADKYWRVEDDKINTDRTVSLDMVLAEFKQKEIELPKNIDSFQDFKSHLKSTTRVIREDKKGIQKAEYVEIGDDHLLHACNYAKLAVNIFDVVLPEIFML